jgi:hypothetical protein
LRPSGKGGYREARIDANAILSRLYGTVAKEASVDIAWNCDRRGKKRDPRKVVTISTGQYLGQRARICAVPSLSRLAIPGRADR